MGFSFRKSFNVGPLRVNLSKRGVGASVGMKGLRVGSGPRGSYLRAEKYGLHYQTSLSSSSSAAATKKPRLAANLLQLLGIGLPVCGGVYWGVAGGILGACFGIVLFIKGHRLAIR